MSVVIPATYDALVQAAKQVQASRFLSVASYALLLYDFVLTFPREVSLVWTAKWSIVKILFFINRYTVPAVITANVVALTGLTPGLSATVCRVCRSVMIILICWQIVSMALVDAIVSLRIHALWQRRHSVFVIMAVLFLLTYATTIVLVGYITSQFYDTIGYLAPYGLCYALPPHTIWTVWLPGVLFEALICIITFVRTWHYYKVDKVPFRRALVRDGLVYFLITLLARLFDLLLWALSPGSLMLLGEHFAFAIINVVCSRLLLNLRGVRTREDWSEAISIVETETTRTDEGPILWLADQGGQSFLEQISRRVYNPQTRPSFTYMDTYEVS